MNRIYKRWTARHRTRSSTFAINTKKTKIAKELALFHPHNETTVHLETKDKAQTANKGYEIMAGEKVIWKFTDII